MNIDTLSISKQIENKFQELKQKDNYIDIARLLTYSFQKNSREHNLQFFGYIPGIFRTIEISLDDNSIESKDIFVGEPVIYKIYYENNQQLYGLNYFYVFCYLKEKSDSLNVYFQSAHPEYKKLTPDEYDLNQKKVSFEGCVSSFDNTDLSVISISDPGHFLPGITSSYYVGSPELNFPKLIAQLIEKITFLSNISLGNTMLFGSSAGTFGALLSSTYMKEKTNVLAVNSQINIRYRKDIMQACYGMSNPKKIVQNFGEKVSCICRFKQKICSVPNIYILANINDNLYQRNFNFYQNYIKRFSNKGINNQSVFDSYYGVDGHGRPESSSLKAKIKIARYILTMKSTL